MFLLDIIEEWAEQQEEHSSAERARQLHELRMKIDHLRDIGYLPENFPPGDLKRSVAEAQVRILEQRAEALGFVRPGEDLALEIGKEVVRGHGGGLGMAADGEGDPSETGQGKDRKVDGFLGLGEGLERVPWSA
jgi:hypothetical protein